MAARTSQSEVRSVRISGLEILGVAKGLDRQTSPTPSVRSCNGRQPTDIKGPESAHPGRVDKSGAFRTADAAAKDEPSGPLCRRPRADRVVDEHEPHRPVPRSWLGKLVPGPEDPGQRHGGGGEPDDHPDGQDPRRGSQRHHDEARDADGQPDLPHSEGPDSHSPASVVLQLRRLVHARDCSTPLRNQGHWSSGSVADGQYPPLPGSVQEQSHRLLTLREVGQGPDQQCGVDCT